MQNIHYTGERMYEQENVYMKQDGGIQQAKGAMTPYLSNKLHSFLFLF